MATAHKAWRTSITAAVVHAGCSTVLIYRCRLTLLQRWLAKVYMRNAVQC